jgi:hypothetical protein
MKIPARQLKRTKTALRNLITERGSPPWPWGDGGSAEELRKDQQDLEQIDRIETVRDVFQFLREQGDRTVFVKYASCLDPLGGFKVEGEVDLKEDEEDFREYLTATYGIGKSEFPDKSTTSQNKRKPTSVIPEEQLIKELKKLEDDELRIDRVAEDFESGDWRYSAIDAWKLARLLGLDLKDTGDWCQTFWARKEDLDDLGLDHPYSEYIELLKGRIPAERYEQLTEMAEEIREDDDKPDLPLTKREIRLLKKAYAVSQVPDSSDVTVATTTIDSSDGVELQFEVCIGDGGDLHDLKSPYDLENGEGFDDSDYIEI